MCFKAANHRKHSKYSKHYYIMMCLKSFFFPHSPIFLINPERIENLTCCLLCVWSWICVCTWWCDMSTAADLLFSALFTKPVTPEQPTPLAQSPRHLTLVPHISLIASDLCFSHWLPVLLFKSFLFFSFTNQLENLNWGDWTQLHNRESLPLISKKHFHNLSWAIFNLLQQKWSMLQQMLHPASTSETRWSLHYTFCTWHSLKKGCTCVF